MRTPLEIIAELKHVTHWSQPNIKYTETMNLLNELEFLLTLEQETNTEDSPQTETILEPTQELPPKQTSDKTLEELPEKSMETKSSPEPKKSQGRSKK
jgi:hypothetical protein